MTLTNCFGKNRKGNAKQKGGELSKSWSKDYSLTLGANVRLYEKVSVHHCSPDENVNKTVPVPTASTGLRLSIRSVRTAHGTSTSIPTLSTGAATAVTTGGLCVRSQNKVGPGVSQPVSGLIKKDLSGIRCIDTYSANHFLQRNLNALADANNNKVSKKTPYLYL